MGGPESRALDDEGLPRPPAVRGKIPRSALRILVRAESVMFVATAVALVVIAVVVFARGVHDLVLAPRGEQFAVFRKLDISSRVDLARIALEHARRGDGEPREWGM